MAQLRLSLDEAARRLGISISTLRRRIRGGTITTERETTAQGFRYVVLLDELEAAAAAEELTAAPPGELLAQVTGERDWLRRRVEEQERTIERLTQQAEHFQVLLRQEQETVKLLTAGREGDAGDEAAPSGPPLRQERAQPAVPRPVGLLDRLWRMWRR